jgi:hypothetical protein
MADLILKPFICVLQRMTSFCSSVLPENTGITRDTTDFTTGTTNYAMGIDTDTAVFY